MEDIVDSAIHALAQHIDIARGAQRYGDHFGIFIVFDPQRHLKRVQVLGFEARIERIRLDCGIVVERTCDQVARVPYLPDHHKNLVCHGILLILRFRAR